MPHPSYLADEARRLAREAQVRQLVLLLRRDDLLPQIRPERSLILHHPQPHDFLKPQRMRIRPRRKKRVRSLQQKRQKIEARSLGPLSPGR